MARKLIAEQEPGYLAVSEVLNKMKPMLEGINRHAISVPFHGTSAEQKQIELWRKYIDFEKSNPLQGDLIDVRGRRGITM